MSELELVELLDNSKKDASNENSSMLKGIVILEALTALRQPASLAHLMQITGMPKASLHRTLAIFEEAGLVMREPGGKAYTPGDRLANLALETLCHDNVSGVRHSILRKLVSDLKETCNLAILRRGELFYLDRVEANWALRLHLPPGTVLPPHCSASGKLLLAFKPPEERAKLLDNLPLEQFTHRTIVDRDVLESELNRITSTEYAVDNEEYVLGVSCVAVPVRDKHGDAVAAIAIHAATARLPLNQAMEYIPQLRAAAERISNTLS
ncbi:MAG: IclR family transcriptional regulator [Polynucleobacter sp.]|mgnify:FL=1|jgi:DNA-binding IclR family transcriptional regulator|uniref:IclR family transcriptional regulator n=1 Tax=Polynucleobacter sp. TaxID=2029855 RepID=UPI002717EED8|nr:IclR family transcriptional regulator [Polynucleobacter sp.]MDO9013699.1 IclR family transcriptional regulator [Polynucleobacter sp.]MDP3122196.1 IclR family transcriptional regulator [Polynucleobacter sp.]